MKPRYGEFQVVGKRNYRDHPPGTTFQARLERNAEGRAIARGDLRLIRVVEPCLEPGSYEFPPGWLSAEPAAHQPRRPQRAPLSLGR